MYLWVPSPLLFPSSEWARAHCDFQFKIIPHQKGKRSRKPAQPFPNHVEQTQKPFRLIKVFALMAFQSVLYPLFGVTIRGSESFPLIRYPKLCKLICIHTFHVEKGLTRPQWNAKFVNNFSHLAIYIYYSNKTQNKAKFILKIKQSENNANLCQPINSQCWQNELNEKT